MADAEDARAKAVSIYAVPGTLPKVEVNTNVSKYALAPGIAIFRIVYQSETFNGTSVPASANVLWPYQAHTLSDGAYPVVAWAHGTSGIYANSAPSNLKNLFQHFAVPYPLALQGYVTVAPDYAWLGVANTADGKKIVHQYIANPAHANDLFYAIQAAQSVFRGLSSEFVIMGHAQGGGYLGAIALSPVTNVLELPDTGNPLIPVLGTFMAPGIKTLFPAFDPSSIFTDIGWQRFQAYGQAQGCTPVAIESLTGVQLLNKDWMQNKFVQQYVQLTSNGGKQIGGPLLVIQGESDPNMNITTTSSAVEKLVPAFPKASVEYVTLPGITHTPPLYASQRLWLDWVEARFAGAQVTPGYQKSEASGFPRTIPSCASDADWIISVATEPFQLS